MIAVDAMGGDRAPETIVKGAVAAAQKGIPILLCGDKQLLEKILTKVSFGWEKLPIQIDHAPEAIQMDDDPTKSVRSKKKSSLVCAIKAATEQRAQAAVSAGNSGAVLVAAVLHSGRAFGVRRPAIGSFLPTKKGSVFCIDLGANVDCKADHLFQFGLMGHAFVSLFCGIEKPRIALLSNGHEPYKGNEQVKKAYDLFAYSHLNFVGNIESRELFDDKTDVVVCDGFTGNVMLKTMHGMVSTLLFWLKQESNNLSWFQRVLFYWNRQLFKQIKKRTDYAAVGGALLLGVNHPIVVAHGSSDERAVCNAIEFAYQAAQEKRVDAFNQALKKIVKQEKSFTGVVRQKVRSLFGLRRV